jgi:hypothetical protein
VRRECGEIEEPARAETALELGLIAREVEMGRGDERATASMALRRDTRDRLGCDALLQQRVQGSGIEPPVGAERHTEHTSLGLDVPICSDRESENTLRFRVV